MQSDAAPSPRPSARHALPTPTPCDPPSTPGDAWSFVAYLLVVAFVLGLGALL